MRVESPCIRRPISIHAPRVGSDDTLSNIYGEAGEFQSTLPVWGATSCLCSWHWSLRYFNPRSPCGERLGSLLQLQRRIDFNPRSPCGERLGHRLLLADAERFQSTLPVWGATSRRVRRAVGHMISIHAPRVGSDVHHARDVAFLVDFNPRSPCGERRWCEGRIAGFEAFQSTLPVWGATFVVTEHTDVDLLFQSTLPVWGATLALVQELDSSGISIHAPRVGSDHQLASQRLRSKNFNPRSPCGERPGYTTMTGTTALISIHAPRVGSDRQRRSARTWAPYFNPRSPCGERLVFEVFGTWLDVFQSTLPVWGATALLPMVPALSMISIHAPRVGSDRPSEHHAQLHGISIHAPRVGSDPSRCRVPRCGPYFNPRSPCGERRDGLPVHARQVNISIHAPRVGSDRTEGARAGARGISIHAPRVGSDQA